MLRYPCACEIQSAADSCPHVDALLAKMFGVKIATLNSVAAMEAERDEEREEWEL